MKLTKHWQFIVALLGIILLNEFIYSFKPSPPVEFISNIIIGIGIIAILIAWISFGIRKRKNKDSAQIQQQLEHSKSSYKLSFRFGILLVGIILLIISFGKEAGKRTIEDLQRQSDSIFSSFYLSSGFIQFIFVYIFCVSLYFLFLNYKEKKIEALFIFINIGIIFNPFIPLHFDKDFLNIIKLITIAFLGYFAFKELKFSNKNELRRSR